MALDFDGAVMILGLHEEQRQRDLARAQMGEQAIDADTLSEQMVF